MTSAEDYVKEMKETAVLIWMTVPFLIIMSLIWLYFGGMKGPWIILGFAIFQNIPLGFMYMARHKRAKARLVPFEEKEWHPSQMMTDDPIAAEVMTRALNSGNIVFANLDDDELFDALRSDRLKGEDARQFAYRKVGNRYQQYAQTMMGG